MYLNLWKTGAYDLGVSFADLYRPRCYLCGQNPERG